MPHTNERNIKPNLVLSGVSNFTASQVPNNQNLNTFGSKMKNT